MMTFKYNKVPMEEKEEEKFSDFVREFKKVQLDNKFDFEQTKELLKLFICKNRD